MIDLSIIIVNYNTCEIVNNCISTIIQETKRILFEIIVVDNASRDDSVNQIKKRFPSVRLIENKFNRGFAAANNQGISFAKGRYVLFLNSDTIVIDSAVEKMVNFLEGHLDIDALGCKLLNEDFTLQPSCYHFPSLLPIMGYILHLWLIPSLKKTILVQTLILKDYNNVHPVDYVRGACLLVRKHTINKIGVFDEQYFMYTEEVDFCFRLKKAGFKLYYYPFAEIVHLGGKSSDPKSTELYIEKYKNTMKYFQKHYGNRKVLTYRFLVMLKLSVQIIERMICNVSRCLFKQKIKSNEMNMELFFWLWRRNEK